MNIYKNEEVKAITETIIEKVPELKGKNWKFKFIKAKRTLGSCNLSDKSIRISTVHIENSEKENVKDTILHEIAHAIDYERRGTSSHDTVWKNICREIGAEPERLKENPYINKIAYKYHVTCPNHGIIAKRHRKAKGTKICVKCSEIVEFVKQY